MGNPFTASYQTYTLHFKQPAGTSRGVLRSKPACFLRLAAPGRVGLGEAALWPGLSPDDRPDFEARLAAVCRALNRGQPPAELDLAAWPALAFGLETARLDWAGGGTRRLFDTPFSRGKESIPLHGLIWMGRPADMLQQVHHKISQGHTCLKLKVGALDFDTECALLADIRRHYSPETVELRLDTNGAFSADAALDRLGRLAQFHIHSLEQPLKPGQWPALAALCAHSPINIALDEELIGLTTPAQKTALLAQVKPHYLVLKPALLGGIAAAQEWITLAQAAGTGWWVNSALESTIGLNALAQWVSFLRPAGVQALGTGQLFTNNIPSPLRPAHGALTLDPALAWDVSAITANLPAAPHA